VAELYVPLTDGEIRLEKLVEDHREPLRAACAEDQEIWTIYPVSYLGKHFDPNFGLMVHGIGGRQPYAISNGDELVGMTAWIAEGAPGWTVEIGNSYIVPRLRGTGFNSRLKRLMMDHAFACGIKRMVYKVDNINERSKAAVLKLGCTQEGLLRQDRLTWTGRIRDTAVFSILADEWAARSTAG
jgi:RimJ/RimL family protein N-acetyltransferase